VSEPFLGTLTVLIIHLRRAPPLRLYSDGWTQAIRIDRLDRLEDVSQRVDELPVAKTLSSDSE
jgi:hypothetical protein